MLTSLLNLCFKIFSNKKNRNSVLRLLRNGVDICPFDPKECEYNEQFYETFRNKITRAKSSMWITGEGIVGESESEKKLGENLSKAIQHKVIDNPSFELTRIQTTINISTHWKKQLIKLLNLNVSPNDKRFQLYFAPTQILYTCVIDPSIPNTSCLEIMVPMKSSKGEGEEIAGFGFFVNKKNYVSEYIRTKINQLLSQSISFQHFERIHKRQISSSGLSENDIEADYRALKSIVVNIKTSDELETYLGIINDLPRLNLQRA